MRQDKQLAKDKGVPTWLRRYSARYGRGVGDLVATHKKNPAPTLDHGRDRAETKILEATCSGEVPEEV